MVGERPKLTASEIEAVLRAALQELPSLRGTKDRNERLLLRACSGNTCVTTLSPRRKSTWRKETGVSAASASPLSIAALI